jgi:hypothetical protein
MIRSIYYSNLQSCLTYGITLFGRDKESNTIFKFQKQVIQIISGVSNVEHVSKYLEITMYQYCIIYTY